MVENVYVQKFQLVGSNQMVGWISMQIHGGQMFNVQPILFLLYGKLVSNSAVNTRI